MNDKRVWLYSRVAYPDMGELEFQKTHLIDYAKKYGFSIVGVTAEQGSGLDFSRAGLREVLVAAENGEIDCVLVENLSRLGRNCVKANGCIQWLRDRGVDVICADGTLIETYTEILAKLIEVSGVSFNRT